MKFEVHKEPDLTIKQKQDIQTLIDSFNGLIYHEIDFNRIASKHFKTELYYALCYIKTEVVAFTPLHFIKTTPLTYCYSRIIYDVPYGGWVYNNEFIKEDQLIKEFFKKQNKLSSYIYTSNILAKTKEIETFLKTGNLKSLKETLLVDLSKSQDEIWESFSSEKRNKIRKAAKFGISVETVNVENKEIILNMILDLHKKLNYNYLPIDFYSEIIDFYRESNKIKIFTAFQNNKPIAGVLLAGNKNIYHYWKGVSAHNVSNNGQGELLQWESIKFAKLKEAKFYDLCVIDKEKLPGIYRFKAGFSKELYCFVTINRTSTFFKIIKRVIK